MNFIKKLLKVVAIIIGIVLLAIVLLVGAWYGWYACTMRSIDCVYASYNEMVERPAESKYNAVCTRAAEMWTPKAATEIHYKSEKKFGVFTVRLSCRVSEADFLSFAQEHSHVVATNSFTMLDYGIDGDSPDEQEDAETQRRLVFDDAPAPKRFFSITKSHAFDGGAIGGSSREIVVFDRDAGLLTGYIYHNFL